MKVYNLTEQSLIFRGVSIPPNGGFIDYPSMDTFISNRDRAMEKKGVIAFEKLPFGWKPAAIRAAKAKTSPPPPAPVKKAVVKEEPKKAQSYTALENENEKPLSTGWVEKKLGKKE